MDWIRAHPYASALAVAGLLVIAGAVIVEERSPAPLSDSTATWNGGVPLNAYQQENPGTQQPQTIPQEIIQNQSPENATLPAVSTAPTVAPTEPSSSFDYAALIAEISGTSSKPSASGESSGSGSASQVLSQAYAFVPQGLVATTAPAKQPMTASQQALYNYGNEVGSTIQSFETEHPDQAQILKDQAEDRSDPAKAAALVSLGQALAAVGTQMQAMGDVPSSVTSLHNALAQSYQNIGANLQLIPKAQRDSDFVSAIETYDASADTFTKNYAALAEYFSAEGVVFGPQDPGSEFSFTDSTGL